MNFVSKNWKGILLCFCIAAPSWILGRQFPIVGGPVIAILAGMVLTLLIKDKSNLESGIKYTSKKILQYAVILLGFGLNLQVILQTGKQSLPIILSTITISLVIAYVLHKAMHIPGKISTLVGVGSSICGGAGDLGHLFLQCTGRCFVSDIGRHSWVCDGFGRGVWRVCRNGGQ